MKIPRRCLDCGQLSPRSRCVACEAEIKAIRNADAARCSAQVRDFPWCFRCGATTDLTAQHVVPISVSRRAGGDLETLCRSCNSSLGNR